MHWYGSGSLVEVDTNKKPGLLWWLWWWWQLTPTKRSNVGGGSPWLGPSTVITSTQPGLWLRVADNSRPGYCYPPAKLPEAKLAGTKCVFVFVGNKCVYLRVCVFVFVYLYFCVRELGLILLLAAKLPEAKLVWNIYMIVNLNLCFCTNTNL